MKSHKIGATWCVGSGVQGEPLVCLVPVWTGRTDDESRAIAERIARLLDGTEPCRHDLERLEVQEREGVVCEPDAITIPPEVAMELEVDLCGDGRCPIPTCPACSGRGRG